MDITKFHLQDREDSIMASIIYTGLYQFRLYAQLLTVEHFLDGICREVWRQMEDLAREGKDWKRKSILLESKTVAKMFKVPLEKAIKWADSPWQIYSSRNPETLQEIVRPLVDSLLRRKVMSLCHTVSKKVEEVSGDPIAELEKALTEAKADWKPFSIEEGIPDVSLSNYLSELEKAGKGEAGVTSHINELNQMIGGV